MIQDVEKLVAEMKGTCGAEQYRRVMRGLRVYTNASAGWDEYDLDELKEVKPDTIENILIKRWSKYPTFDGPRRPQLIDETQLVGAWLKFGTFQRREWKDAKSNLAKAVCIRLLGKSSVESQHNWGDILAAKRAAKLLHRFDEKKISDTSLLDAAVACVALARVKIGLRTVCKYCNRYSVHGKNTCREHKQERATTGRNVDGYPTNRELIIDLARQAKLGIQHWEGESLLDAMYKYSMLEIIFPTTRDGRREDLLGAAPQHLGGKPLHPRLMNILKVTSAEELVKCTHDEFLKKTLDYDPLDFSNNSRYWIYKLWDASNQAYMEDSVLAARRSRIVPRGKGKKTITAVDQAIAFAKAGKTASEIAAELDVGKSAVSNWRKRYPDFDLVLRAQNGHTTK
ncbi:MAG: helix-turn-helix domain-containing protein [Sulfuricella sp.]